MKHIFQGISNNKNVRANKKKEGGRNPVKLLITGALIGYAYDGIKSITNSADLTVGILKETTEEKERVLNAAEKAGFDLVAKEEKLRNSCIRKVVKNVDVAVLGFDSEMDMTCDNLKKTIREARMDGADFVLVYATLNAKTEKAMAKRIAEAGADYIFGYGRKKTGPYDVILTGDQGKIVPVVYNLNSLGRKTGTTVLMEVVLEKYDGYGTEIVSEGYYPCRGAGKLMPVEVALKKCKNAEERIGCEESFITANYSMGFQERCQCYASVDKELIELLPQKLSSQQGMYEIQPVLTAKKAVTELKMANNPYMYDEEKGCYARSKDEAQREASIVCTGLIQYSRILEKDAECFGNYEFLKSFKTVANCFENADFVIGNLTAMASPVYPSTGEVSLETRKAGYANCRKEYVTGLQKAGFTGLALASPYNGGLGIEGILDTEETIKNCAMIPAGIGKEKNPIVEINGIKVGILSVTTGRIGGKYILTDEAATRFINILDKADTKRNLEELRNQGAEFILAYINCGMNKNTMELEDRKQVAETIAEMGADYIICTGAMEVSPYYRYNTQDGRRVSIATSLGCFQVAKKDQTVFDAALIKLFIRRTFDGKLELDDNYIPIRIFAQHEGVQHVVMPAQRYFNKNYRKTVYRETEEHVAASIGAEIKRNCQRATKLNEGYTKNFTFAQLYDFFGQSPTERDLERLGDRYHQQIPFFSLKKETFREGCVAILYDYINYGKTAKLEWDIQTCIDAGVSLVIDNKYHEELPCIVVEEPLMEVYEKLVNTVINWYNPIKVAITGSMGKTTTKEMAVEVFNNHFKTLTNGGNANVIYQIGLMAQKLQDDDGAYVQEVHGGTIGMASATSRMMEPDICILTNIEKNHMSQVKTVESLVASKMGIIDGLKEGGVFIACQDNEFLKDIDPPVRTIKYSISDENCHYYARNIQVSDEGITFDIVVRESEFDNAGVYPAKISMQGEHNVGNAIAAFAAGRQAGIPPHEIIAGLSRYRTKGIRQNYFEHNGIQMLLDTHNSNPKALLAMFDVLDQMKPKKTGRKILILGMMGEQGDDSQQIHYDTGKLICNHDFDIAFCYGEDAKYMVEAVKDCGKKAYYFEKRDIFNKVIAETLHPGDVVMVKGSHSMGLDTETMVPIFGKAIQQQ